MYLNDVTITPKRGIKNNLKTSSDRVNYFPSITEYNFKNLYSQYNNKDIMS